MTTRNRLDSMSRAALGLLAIALALAPRPAAAVEVMPLVGVNMPTGDWGDNFDAGGHFGLGIGGRVTSFLSIHGQGHAFLLNPEQAPDDSNTTGFALALAPLFHLMTTPGADLVAGPTLGIYRFSFDTTVLGRNVSGRRTGLSLGLQTAALFRVSSDVALGPVISYQRLFDDEVCGEALGQTVCDDDPDDNDDAVLSLGLAVWF